MKNGTEPLPQQQPGPPPDFDWMEAFNVAAAQRDETTRTLQNFQVQAAVEKKKLAERIAELEAEIEALKKS